MCEAITRRRQMAMADMNSLYGPQTPEDTLALFLSMILTHTQKGWDSLDENTGFVWLKINTYQ